MERRSPCAGFLILATVLTGSAAVADPLNEIATELRQQGYQITEVRRTWLGRIQVTAETRNVRREIVFDRVTGEVRRDLVEQKSPDAPPKPQGLGAAIARGIQQLTGVQPERGRTWSGSPWRGGRLRFRRPRRQRRCPGPSWPGRRRELRQLGGR
jgi:hypothetical protein